MISVEQVNICIGINLFFQPSFLNTSITFDDTVHVFLK